MALFTHPNVTPNPYNCLCFAENYKISLQTFNQLCIVVSLVYANKQCALFLDITCTQISPFVSKFLFKLV